MKKQPLPAGLLAALLGTLSAAAMGANLSDTATASATSNMQPASYAVDGDGSTRWESSHGVDPSSLTLDLGQAYDLSQTVIYWEAANAGDYEIQGSADGNSWNTLATRSGGSFGARTDTVPLAGTYRYVRMHGTSRSDGNNWGYSIWEMEVYGEPPAPDEVDLTNTGGTISSQYADSPAGEGHGNLVDNDTATKYLTFNASSWVQWQVGEPYVVDRYSLSSANDAPQRDPASWTLQGSNNGTNWTTIDSRAGEDFANRYQTREFSFNNGAGYSYYRFNLTNNSGGILQLSEFELFGVPGEGSSSSSSQASSSSSVSGDCADGCLNMVDAQTLRATVSEGDTVDIHYTVNGGAQQNMRMTDTGSGWIHDIGNLANGDLVSVSFTVITNGAGESLPWRDYTVGDGSTSSSSQSSATSSSSSSSSSSSVVSSSSSSSNSSVPLGPVTPLYNSNTQLEPVIQYDRGDALVTRFSDRARDRHAKEDHFQAYEHYLSFYWEDRTAGIEIVDKVAKGGNTVRMNVVTQFKLSDTEAENRWFYRGVGTVAEYCDNGTMVVEDNTHYHKERSYNCREGRPIQVGDKLEFEISQFLDASVPNGRANYYGTTYLYIVGEGLVAWDAGGTTLAGGVKDSFKIPESAWLGGETTVHELTSGEPDNVFLQMATNMGYDNAQPFMQGRRVLHSSFVDGVHDEKPIENPAFNPAIGKAGPLAINDSCASCHVRNGRAAPNPVGEPLDQWVFQVGDANANPHPAMGRVLQPTASGGAQSEGTVSIASWTEQNGLRSPNFQFSGATPERFSARIAPQLVGIGLLEAIPEGAILANEDPGDADGDGISGRANRVTDPVTGNTHLGRFGWKAGSHSVEDQVASAFNTDMGVMTSTHPTPDCGDAQSGCGASGSELADVHVDNLVKYISLLGVRPQRNYDDPAVQNGEMVFDNTGCADCHTPSFQTSQHHPFAELRDQAIKPYTDMLLHDMGPGLADNLGEGEATGSEWRTTPLWSLGRSACVLGGVTDAGQGDQECTPVHSYLHDGRARSIEEAILWHGGEAAAAKQSYEALSAQAKSDLLAFLRSL